MAGSLHATARSQCHARRLLDLLEAHDVGFLKGMGGLITCATPLAIPRVQRRLGGAVATARFGALLAGPFTALLPATRVLALATNSRIATLALGAALVVPRELGKSCLFIATFQVRRRHNTVTHSCEPAMCLPLDHPGAPERG